MQASRVIPHRSYLPLPLRLGRFPSPLHSSPRPVPLAANGSRASPPAARPVVRAPPPLTPADSGGAGPAACAHRAGRRLPRSERHGGRCSGPARGRSEPRRGRSRGHRGGAAGGVRSDDADRGAVAEAARRAAAASDFVAGPARHRRPRGRGARFPALAPRRRLHALAGELTCASHIASAVH